jgi:hypothetical protein
MRDPADPVRQQLGWYMRNCAMSAAAIRLEFVLLERLNVLKGIPSHDEDSADLSKPEQRRALLRELLQLLQAYSGPGASSESLEQNARFARDEFDLDEIDTEILLLLLRYERNSHLEEFADEVARLFGSASRAIAALIGHETREVHRRIMPRSSLLGGGLLTINDDGTDVAGRCGLLQLAPPLRKTMFRPYNSREEWAEDVFGAPLAADLEWSDYDHLGDTRDLTAALLAGAAKRNAEGVNILIYGPVGTGKTEFCKVLAAQCGLNLWSVGEADEQGGEPNRRERLASMRLAHRLLKCRRNAAILFDEAEDLLAQDGGSLFGLKVRGRNGSKVHINRVIEQNPVPVLWTCNDVDCMDLAVLRRMGALHGRQAAHPRRGPAHRPQHRQAAEVAALLSGRPSMRDTPGSFLFEKPARGRQGTSTLSRISVNMTFKYDSSLCSARENRGFRKPPPTPLSL